MKARKKTSNVQRRTPNAQRRLARRIAKALFTRGDGIRATRLVIETPDRNFGGECGYCEWAVAEIIADHLLKSVVKKSGGKRG